MSFFDEKKDNNTNYEGILTLKSKLVNGDGNSMITVSQNDAEMMLSIINEYESMSKDMSSISHFLSIKIDNPALIAFGESLQEIMIQKYKSNYHVDISKSLIKAETFHVSLNMLYISNSYQLNKFKFIFSQIKIFFKHNFDITKIQLNDDIFKKYALLFKRIYKKNQMKLECKGLNDFSRKIIFMDFQKSCQRNMPKSIQILDAILAKLNYHNEFFTLFYQFINEVCMDNGLKIAKDKWIPHMTLFKTTKLRGNKSKKWKLNKGFNKDFLNEILTQNIFDSYKPTNNIYQNVMSIDVCAMQGRKNGEYYQILDTLEL